MSREPLVSAIIPVYNGERFLPDALDSVMGQAHRPLEIIVVDDGSTDRTAEIVGRYPEARSIYQDNQGPASARNTGLRAAEGKFMGLLDADDLWSEDKLAVQMPCFVADPSLQIVMGHTQILLQTESTDHRVVFEEYATPWLAPQVGCTLFRKEMLDRVGFFPTELQYGEDLDWFLRISEQRISRKVVPEVTLYYRWHGDNLCRGKSVRELGYTRAIKRSLDRRRPAGLSDLSSQHREKRTSGR